MTREPIYAALFTALSTLPGFATKSRRLRHWSDVTPAEQPTLFQVQRRETPHETTGVPPRWTLTVDLFLYAHGSDPTATPAALINPLVDAIEALLQAAPGETAQTLGGLASHARIAGPIETDEGVCLATRRLPSSPSRFLQPEESSMDDTVYAEVASAASEPNGAPSASADTVSAGPAATDIIVERWFSDWMHGSVIATVTSHFNHAFAAKEDLKRRLAQEI
jgi:hypothetical protein